MEVLEIRGVFSRLIAKSDRTSTRCYSILVYLTLAINFDQSLVLVQYSLLTIYVYFTSQRFTSLPFKNKTSGENPNPIAVALGEATSFLDFL